MKIYPNPAHEILFINATKLVGKKRIEFFDSEGKLLYTNTFSEDIKNIDLTDFSPGTYLVKVLFNNQIVNTQKIIITHSQR